MPSESTELLPVAVNGASGRMGQRVVALVLADETLQLAGAIVEEGSPFIGRDAGEVAGAGPAGVAVGTALPPQTALVIDFSTPGGVLSIAEACAGANIPLVAATTGLTETQETRLLAAGEQMPFLWEPNLSLAVNVAMELTRIAARVLQNAPGGCDVEVIERHHRFKEDAPSGTALKFGRIVAEEMGQTEMVHGREGRSGARAASEIGFHAVRTGNNVGEHEIVFGMLSESLHVDVRGQSRDSYAAGAIAAGKKLVGREPGRHSLRSLLGLDRLG